MIAALARSAVPAALALSVAPVCWVAFAVVARRGGCRWRFALLAASLGAAGATALVFQGAELARTAAAEPRPARLVLMPGTWAFTDSWSNVPVGMPLDPPPDQDIPERFQSRVIAAGNADATSNCHGWVFVEGRYWIPTESVDTILKDNGYILVEHPEAGDLIVYRDHDGRPFHTGIVKALGGDGFVLVESKWGQCGVFWHIPIDQAFGDEIEYWHAAREGHTLRLSRSPGPGVPPRPSGKAVE
jgi:hypothetical protein